MIEVDTDRNIQVHAVDIDLFRYSTQTIDAEDLSLGRDLRQLIAKRINKLQSGGRSSFVDSMESTDGLGTSQHGRSGGH